MEEDQFYVIDFLVSSGIIGPEFVNRQVFVDTQNKDIGQDMGGSFERSISVPEDVPKKSEAKNRPLLEKICELTKARKITWFKMNMSLFHYFYRCQYRSIGLIIHPLGDMGSYLQVSTLDVFGYRANTTDLICYKGDFDDLVIIIEETNPRSFDAMHDHPLVKDHRTDLVEKILEFFSYP